MNHKYEKYLNKKAIVDCWSFHQKPKKDKYDFVISIPSYCEFDYLFKTLDSINYRYGNSTLKIAAEGIDKRWKMQRKKISPCYTTRFNEIMIVRS